MRGVWLESLQVIESKPSLTPQLECSYDSTRPASIMFGHLSPPGIMHELQTLASLVGGER